MKKIIFTFFILCMASQALKAQSVNGIPISEIDVEFIQILGHSKLFSDKVSISLDFGQDTKFFSDRKAEDIRDNEGKKVKFNSMIDALNFMSSHGFEFVQAYAFAVNNQNVYHYLMKQSNN